MLPSYDNLLRQIGRVAPRPCVVVEPYVVEAVSAIATAFAEAMPTVWLTGDAARIRPLVAASGLDPDKVEIVEASTSAAAVAEAARLVLSGQADFVVKGSVSSAELLRGLLGRDRLGAGRVASHLYIIEAPAYGGRTLAFADAGVNVAPDLKVKADIIRNSCDALRAIGIERPSFAALAAVELVKPDLASTIDAALLTVMAKRGQLGVVDVDGPLSIDAALSEAAAAAKSLSGPVAGFADALLAPDLNSANMTSKALIGATGRAMGIVVGAQVPIALPSRGDSQTTRSHSLLLASYLAGANDLQPMTAGAR